MNPEKYPGAERSPINKIEEAIEKLELVTLLQQSGYSSVDELPENIVDRAKEIALLDGIDDINQVKELTVIEFIIQQLAEKGASAEEIAEEVESSLYEVTALLLAAPGRTVTEEETKMVLRGTLQKSPTGAQFTNHLLESVAARKAIRSQM